MNDNGTYRGGFFEAQGENMTKKYAVVILRWLLIIASAALVLSILWSGEASDQRVVIHGIILLLLVSNVVVSFLPKETFENSLLVHGIVLSDITLISAAMWLTGSFGSDFYLLYFLIIMIAAISGNLRSVVATAVIIPSIYVAMVIFGSGAGELLKTEVLIRVPFFFVAAVFYGYLVALVKRERIAKTRYKKRLSVATQLREFSYIIGESLERERILQLLVDCQRELCGNTRVAILSRGRKATVVDSTPGSAEQLEPGIFAALDDALRERANGDSPLPSVETKGAVSDIGFVIELGALTLLPVNGSLESDLYIALFGEVEDDMIEYTRILLMNASITLKNAGQYQALVHEVEKRQELAGELSNALEFKSEFLRNMSHELRTPICCLMGFGELLLDNDYGRLSKEQASVIDRMLSCSDDLLDMINNVLRFSKLDAGDVTVSAQDGDVEVFLRDTVEGCRPLLKDKAISLTSECINQVPTVATDWTLLRQVTNNLISNAIKFTDVGQVHIAADFNDTTDHIRIAVKDTGIGIEAEKVPEIFEAFRQIDRGYARKYAGTGLGLAITKRQVELLGGNIEVQSIPGKGSIFLVTVPVEVKAEDTQGTLHSSQ